MARHPFHEVVISGVYNTQQARVLEGHDSPEVERVVERHERYVVVEKHDEAATVAEETDPRR